MTDHKECLGCGESKPLSEFPSSTRRSGSVYYRPFCEACKYKKEVENGRTPNKEYHKSYYVDKKLYLKYKSYKHRDKQVFKDCVTVSKEEALNLMSQPCYYCRAPASAGLDRRDNNKGHSIDNVVPCCEKCNNILGDIPAEAKDILMAGLVLIQHKGLLDSWVIPTKRNQKRTNKDGNK